MLAAAGGRTITHGLVVHYALRAMPNTGQERPAVIVRGEDAERAIVTLAVYVLDEDFEDDQVPAAVIRTEPSRYSLSKQPGTWHWIED